MASSGRVKAARSVCGEKRDDVTVHPVAGWRFYDRQLL